MPFDRAVAAALALASFAGCAGPRAAANSGTPARRGEWVLLGRRPLVLADPESFSPPEGCITVAGFAGEERGTAICYPAHILATDDGGKSWRRSRMPLTNGALGALEILGPMAWTSTGNLLRVSSDGGETWRELPNHGGQYSAGHFFSFVSAEIGWYSQGLNRGTLPMLSATRDGGLTWREVPVPPEAENRIVAVSLLSENAGFLLLLPDVLLRTEDGGAHWDRLSLPLRGKTPMSVNPGVPVEALRFSDPLRGTAVLYFEKPRGFAIFDTQDGGKTWREEELPPEGRPRLGNVFLSRDRRYLTVTDLDSGMIVRYRRD